MKTDSNNPAHWLMISESDLEGIELLVAQEMSDWLCMSKLAEVLEKVMKAELLRCGWFLQKTHDLQKLGGELQALNSDLVPRLKPLCNAMSEIYFTNRYPGFDLPSANWVEMRCWIQEVKELLLIVKARVQSPA